MSQSQALPQFDSISLSNLSIASHGDNSSSLQIPPIGDTFARTLTELREAVRRCGDQRVQFAFVNYLLEAAEILSVDPSRLGVTFERLQGMTADDAVAKMQKLFIDEALKWLKRLALHASGIGRQALAEAQFMLAEFYGKGVHGLQVDHKRAFALYTQASKQGHSEAAFRVAVCYEIGAGTKRDCTRAVQFYRKAAAMGNLLAMHKMSKILLHGKLGEQQKLKEGLQWLKRAAASADEKHPEALYDLALCYTEEDCLSIVIPDAPYSFRLFKQAADLGFSSAQARVGAAYEYGTMGCHVDVGESVKYYTQAAEQGHPEAQLGLSNWFLIGAPEANLQQSDFDAFRWSQKAADSGHIKAQYMLGHCYENGIGVRTDLDKAKQWYQRSAASGYRRAKQRLETLENEERMQQRQRRKRCCIIQ